MPGNVLNDKEVVDIRWAVSRKESVNDLACQYDVSPATVRRIARGTTYKDVARRTRCATAHVRERTCV